MTLEQFNSYLKENVTDIMFESLVLDTIIVSYKILSCDIHNGVKTYTLQDEFIGRKFFLVLDTKAELDDEEFPSEQYIIARKDEETLFFLADQIWGQLPKMVPVFARPLLPVINELSDNPSVCFNREPVPFYKTVDDFINKTFDEFVEKEMPKLYDEFIYQLVKGLKDELYILQDYNWVRQRGWVGITNSKNRTSYCSFRLREDCISLYIDHPKHSKVYPIQDEHDIHFAVADTLKIMKNL